MNKDNIKTKVESSEDNVTVKVETFEEIRKKQEKRLESIKEWNAAMSGNKYQPTVAEEMNLDLGPNDDSHYWS